MIEFVGMFVIEQRSDKGEEQYINIEMEGKILPENTPEHIAIMVAVANQANHTHNVIDMIGYVLADETVLWEVDNG